MPQTDLYINSNILEVTKGLDEAVKSTDKLEQNTKDLGTASTKAMNDTQQATSKLSGALKMMGGLMAGAFSVAALVSWGKTIAVSTGAGADGMARFQEGTQRAFQTLNTAIATADFSNLLQGLADAYTEGKRYADVLDEIQARQVALGAFKATLETQQAEQKLIARNAQNSVDVRMAAIDKIVELEKQKLSETLSLQNTELDEALRAAAIRTGINTKDDEGLKQRKLLVEEWARAYGTVEGVNKLNEQLTKANALQSSLDALVTRTQLKSGGFISDYSKRDEALLKLTEDEKKLLALRSINEIVTDKERDDINKTMQSKSQSTTQAIEQEVALQRLKSTLINELLGKKEDEAKADKERVKSTVEENLESLDKYVEEANKKTFDIELGFGGMQSAEEFQKQIDDNLKDFEFTMNLTPEFSTDESIEAQAWDDAYKMMQDNLADFEKIQQETWARMQQFADDHPFAEAMGFENEEQLDQVKDYVGQLVEFANELIDQQVQATQRIVDDQNTRIEEQQQLVNQEFQLKEEGLANNYRVEAESLKKMQVARDAAIKDREKAIRIQRTMSTIEAGVSLVTAAANIMKGFSGIPVVGVILGLAAVAAMIGGFIAAQSKVKEATQMRMGGRLLGPSHAEGGMRIEGSDVEVEGREWVVNARSSEKYNDVLTAINRDDRKGLQIAVNKHNLMKAFPVTSTINIDDSKKLGEIVRLMKSGDGVFMGNGFYIEQRGTMRKTIRLN